MKWRWRVIGRGESERATAWGWVGLGGNGGVDEVMRHWISSNVVLVYLGQIWVRTWRLWAQWAWPFWGWTSLVRGGEIDRETHLLSFANQTTEKGSLVCTQCCIFHQKTSPQCGQGWYRLWHNPPNPNYPYTTSEKSRLPFWESSVFALVFIIRKYCAYVAFKVLMYGE